MSWSGRAHRGWPGGPVLAGRSGICTPRDPAVILSLVAGLRVFWAIAEVRPPPAPISCDSVEWLFPERRVETDSPYRKYQLCGFPFLRLREHGADGAAHTPVIVRQGY